MSNHNSILKKSILFAVMTLSVFLSGFVNFNSLKNQTIHNSLSKDSLSSETQDCIDCHINVTPGIVKDWETSRHSHTVVKDALLKSPLQKRISAVNIPAVLQDHVVGCYECHSRNIEKHKDNFEHFGYKINVIVTPNDCATCHPVEVSQYEKSKKANAYNNLMGNPVYHLLVNTINGLKKIKDDKIISEIPGDVTLNESCLGCHGTIVNVAGTDTVHSAIGDVEVPKLSNWPNQGVGRINPDSSKGSCTACHTRHAFSIEVARKPYTCSQCHLEPDVPAWEIYRESKHGNIFFSKSNEWNMNNVPWIVGKDFQAPTCAVCHNSLLVSPDSTVIAERTHDFGARLWVRIFGLIYSHPQPKSGNTAIILNQDNLPLPTTFNDELADKYLIDLKEQKKRVELMETICESCHSTNWTENHFTHLDSVIVQTDEMTKSSTQLVAEAWKKGIEDKANPFDEEIEKMWIEQWLFYANTMRYSAAMTGAPDYQAFKHGWWDMSKNLDQMKNTIELKTMLKNFHKK
jgi:hydroxylamine dehydrogenase